MRNKKEYGGKLKSIKAYYMTTGLINTEKA